MSQAFRPLTHLVQKKHRKILQQHIRQHCSNSKVPALEMSILQYCSNIYNIAATLRIDISDILSLLQYCWNIVAIFCNIFAILCCTGWCVDAHHRGQNPICRDICWKSVYTLRYSLHIVQHIHLFCIRYHRASYLLYIMSPRTHLVRNAFTTQFSGIRDSSLS